MHCTSLMLNPQSDGNGTVVVVMQSPTHASDGVCVDNGRENRRAVVVVELVRVTVSAGDASRTVMPENPEPFSRFSLNIGITLYQLSVYM